MLAKNNQDKYRKYRKNNKWTKIPDVERKETRKGPEMSANKIAQVQLTDALCSNVNIP